MGDEKKWQEWVVLATGGTIAGTAESVNDHTGYTAGRLGVKALLDAVPGVSELLQGDGLHAEQLAQLDSKDMDHACWQKLARRCSEWLAQPGVGGLVITHGTDTLEETAWFLQQVLGSPKPVVLTCAMRPATALMSDGPQNLLDALTVVRDPMARGVLVVCAGAVHAARTVQKVHPYRLDAFRSGEAGPLGWVEQGQVRWAGRSVACEPHIHAQQALLMDAQQWPWVEVVHSHAGADARQVQALVAAGVRGLVVAGTGNGTVHARLMEALLQAQSAGVAVGLASRCPEGEIVGIPVLPVGQAGLNAHKARISLMLDLMVTARGR